MKRSLLILSFLLVTVLSAPALLAQCAQCQFDDTCGDGTIGGVDCKFTSQGFCYEVGICPYTAATPFQAQYRVVAVRAIPPEGKAVPQPKALRKRARVLVASK